MTFAMTGLESLSYSDLLMLAHPQGVPLPAKTILAMQELKRRIIEYDRMNHALRESWALSQREATEAIDRLRAAEAQVAQLQIALEARK